MADKKEEVVIEVVGETAVKKTSAKTTKTSTTTKTATAKTTAAKSATTAKKPAAKKTAAEVKVEEPAVQESPVTETVVAETAQAKAPATKKVSKKQATKAPLYINGRYVVEKQLPAKPKKGAKPYADAKGSVKVTLVKSTAGCLKDQQATVKALGLTKIRSSKVLPDNDATRGMIFKVKHLVAVEEVK